jgi:hypothetical protein
VISYDKINSRIGFAGEKINPVYINIGVGFFVTGQYVMVGIMGWISLIGMFMMIRSKILSKKV